MPKLRTIALVLLFLTANAVSAQDVNVETYTLPNGLTVTLHEDHSLPQVTINTWFLVGSKDEAPGRTGFAHLFEHLMFMGTDRVPGNSFDVIMEGGGGANNASTGTDRTNYYSWGPSSLLPTLLWLDADRLDALGRSMTQEKLDLQRSVVRNERRQNYENSPYGAAGLIIPEALYPEGHPYHHPIIGSHEDLEAASLQDVKDFFATYYVPANASLVVAGDFDPAEARALIEQTFGAVGAKQAPTPRTAVPAHLDGEIRRLAVDKVEQPRLYLVWQSPAIFTDGDAEMDLISSLLADGSSSRLNERLIIDERLAKDVSAYQYSKELGSEFRIQVTANGDADLEHIKRIVIEELARLAKEGPEASELERVKAATEASFLRRMESLDRRADAMNRYWRYLGTADGFQRDLERLLAPTTESIRHWCRTVFTDGRLDLRILPAGATVPEATLDTRPPDLGAKDFAPPSPNSFALSNGVPVHLIERPGSGLFAVTLVVDGGELLVPAGRAGLASLTASMLTAGAGGRSAAEFADAVRSLGADIRSFARWNNLQMGVTGLASRFDETMVLFADALLRPNLDAADFAREKDLAMAGIRSRGDDPGQVARIAASALLFGRDDPRGRATEGYLASVEPIDLEQVVATHRTLIDAGHAELVVVGDVTPEALRTSLEKHLRAWQPVAENGLTPPSPELSSPLKNIVVVDRPGAQQTMIYLTRPLPTPDAQLRAQRDVVNTILGGTFTSRLNQNIREEHGYSYGARSMVYQTGNQHILRAYSAVQSEVTAAALGEFKHELDRLAAEGVSAEELTKAVKSLRYDTMSSMETTAGMAATLGDLVADHRPLDALASHLREVAATDLASADRVAASGTFNWDEMLIVLVGDRATILPQLADAGFGSPLDATVDGELVTPTAP